MFRSHNRLVVVFLWLLATPLVADDATTEEIVNDDAVTEAALGARVFIDEATGKVRSPSAAETAAMAEQFRRQFIDLSIDSPPVYHADGSISKELGQRSHMYSVARISDDGKLEAQCLPVEQAAEFLASPVRASSVKASSVKEGAKERHETKANGGTSQ